MLHVEQSLTLLYVHYSDILAKEIRSRRVENKFDFGVAENAPNLAFFTSAIVTLWYW